MIDRLLKNLYERVLDNEVPARYFEEMIKDGEINPNEYFISVPLLKQNIEEIKLFLEEEQRQKQMKEDSEKPYKKIMFVEDGSVDTEELIFELARTNPEIRVIVYRQGANIPIMKDIKGE